MKMRWIRFPLGILLGLFTVLLLPSIALLQGAVDLTINQVDTEKFPEVTAYVTVTDAQGRPLTGLDESAFEVVEENKAGEQNQPEFSLDTVTETGVPLTVALALDTSQSIRDANALDDVKNAAKDFIDRLGPGDQAALLTFSAQVTSVQEFTSNKDELKQTIDGLQTSPGGTALYEAVCQAADTLIGVTGRKAVVLLTDGWNDSALPRTLDGAIQCGADSNAPVYTLGFGSAHDDSLDPIATDTGGLYRRAPSVAELQELFSGLATQLESQYVIKYKSAFLQDFVLNISVTTPEGTGSDTAAIGIPTPPPTVTPTPTSTPTPSPTSTVTQETPVVLGATPTVTPTPVLDGNGGDGVPLPLLIGGLIVLGGLGGLGVMAVRRDRRPICPNCGRAMDPDWQTCLFCEQEAEATRLQMAPSQPEVTSTREMDFEIQPPAREPDPTMILDVGPKPTAWLVMVEGEREGQEYMLHAGDTAIGREGANDIIVDDPSVSREQAKVRLEDNEFYIYDLVATNTTEVNDQEITKHKLQDGDRVRMGDTVFVFKRTQVAGR